MRKYTDGRCKICERNTLHLDIETGICRKCINKGYQIEQDIL